MVRSRRGQQALQPGLDIVVGIQPRPQFVRTSPPMASELLLWSALDPAATARS